MSCSVIHKETKTKLSFTHSLPFHLLRKKKKQQKTDQSVISHCMKEDKRRPPDK